MELVQLLIIAAIIFGGFTLGHPLVAGIAIGWLAFYVVANLRFKLGV